MNILNKVYTEIPVLDLGPYMAGENGALEELGVQVRNIQETIGFWAVINHGVAWKKLEETYKQLKQFFALSDNEKIAIIQEYFKNIMLTLGLDLNDDSLQGTPYRVAKMYVKEMFEGLKSSEKPKVSLFENKYQYGKMLIEKNISFHSCCEHHFLPIYLLPQAVFRKRLIILQNT